MKGTVFDMFTIAFWSIVTLCIGFLLVFLLTTVQDHTTSEQIDAETLSSGIDGLKAVDWGVAILFFGGLGISLVSAYLTQSHPAFIIVGILLTVILIPVGAILTNVVREFLLQNVFTAGGNHISEFFPISFDIVNNLPLMMIIGCFLILVFLYMKKGDVIIQGA